MTVIASPINAHNMYNCETKCVCSASYILTIDMKFYKNNEQN